MPARPTLILIESTDDTVESSQQTGLWPRHFQTLCRLARSFAVWYYTSDRRSFQENMPEGATHRVFRPGTSIYGLRHVLYYLFLMIQAFRWRKSGNVIAILGVNQPVVQLVKLISGLKVVSVFHYNWAHQTGTNYPWYLPKTFLSPFIQWLSLQSSDCIMCTAPQLLTHVRSHFPHHSARLVPNYVDTKLFKPGSPRKKRIVYVGRLHWSKGVDTLIEAFVLLSEKIPDVELIVIGSGEELSKLKGQAAGSLRIRFVGPAPQGIVAEYLSTARLFVLPTRTMEGHSRALVEAMAAGCLCIASDVPGNRELFMEAGCPEYLFAQGDARNLAQKLEMAMRKGEDTRQYNHAIAHFEEGKVMSDYVETLMACVTWKNRCDPREMTDGPVSR